MTRREKHRLAKRKKMIQDIKEMALCGLGGAALALMFWFAL